MARKPVLVLKRPTTIPGRFVYYIQLWNAEAGRYSTNRSAEAVAVELGLDAKAFPPTPKTGAGLMGQELLKRGGSLTRKGDPTPADYCTEFWDWDRAPYIAGKPARGQRIGREHCKHNAAYIENYVRPAFGKVNLSAIKPYMLEDFAMKLKRGTALGNRSINGILSAITMPLHEAARLGLIPSDPAASIRKLGGDSTEKGIPSEAEMRALLALHDLDPRVRCAILLGAACGLRIGEIQALRLEDIGETTLTVRHSWGKLEGLKCPKNGHTRVVPLPAVIRNGLLTLAAMSPHGGDGFIFYGIRADAPLDVRQLERGFDRAMVQAIPSKAYAPPEYRSPGESLAAYKARTAAAREKYKEAADAIKARNISFHSIRHWSNARLRGAVPDAKLRLQMGHASEAMTDRYDKATETDLAAIAAAQTERLLPFLSNSREGA